MNKPYIVCYMMTSVDGRIDCGMTSQLPGVQEYYPLLKELDLGTAVRGKTTAKLELAEPGEFTADSYTAVEKELVSKKADNSKGYTVVVDTKGSLLWKEDSCYDQPHIIITSQQATEEYLAYLDGKNISYIVAGQNRIDLARAVSILNDMFGVERLGVVGGPAINTAFLDAGLLDEVILLIGAGIDGRESFPSVFNRKDNGKNEPVQLKLMDAKSYESGAVLVRYSTK